MRRRIRWQIALAVAGVVVIGVALAVLSNRRFEDRPARGGELVEAVVGRPAVFNPLFATNDVERDIASLLFCGLTRPDTQGRLRPDLATHWTVEPDGLTYTFELRNDAQWHDGQPVTAEDVVFTAEMAARIARDSALSVAAAPAVRAWERVVANAVDEKTVELHLPEAYAPFLDATMIGLLPKHLLGGTPPGDLANHRYSRVEPIGCGPYRVDLPEGLDGEHARLVRYGDHWDATERKPYLDAVTFQFYPTIEAALEALGQRSVQAMGSVPADALLALGEEASVYSAVEPGMGLVYLNNNTVLFSDPALRKALSLAVDRTGLAGGAETLNGQAQASSDPIPPGSWAHDDSADILTSDPAAAVDALEAIGWTDGDGDGVRDRDGKPMRFTLGSAADPVSLAIASVLESTWEAIGADVTVEPLDQQATVRALSEREYDAMLFSWDLPQYDPDPYPLWHSSQSETGQNYAAFRDSEADRLMVEARRIPPAAENLDVRRDVYAGFQHVFVDLQPSIVLYHPVYSYVVVDPNLGGVQLPQLLVRPSDRFVTLPDWFARTERVFRSDAGGGAR